MFLYGDPTNESIHLLTPPLCKSTIVHDIRHTYWGCMKWKVLF